VRWIDFENRKPTDADISGWVPWTVGEWNKWLEKSTEYLDEVERLHAVGDIDTRNKYIDSKSAHWGKLKPWLLALSYGKCWFTEGREVCSHMDVEHYRPKITRIGLDGVERDGYWWLAFEYANFRLAGTVPNRKKGTWFALHSESRCSEFDARCEESETPYLLDPIIKSDTLLLAFNEEGNAIPAPTCDKWERDRVKASIEHLKLNEHDALPEERRKVWQKVTRAMDAYLAAKASYRPGINPTPLEKMEQNLRVIHQMTRSTAELSKVAFWCIRFRNDPHLISLVGG
jgi:hypothetical protein